MANNNTVLRVTELDFDSIKNNLKTFMRSKPEFTDYDFEGSGLSFLLDVLAYNTHMQAFYQNVEANERFRDTAQIRQNMLSLAKDICYIPASKQGSTTMIDIVATPSNAEDQDINSVVLDRYTRLLGSDIDGVNYPFVTINANSASKVDGSFAFSNVWIKQGEVVTLQYLMTEGNASRRFQIPSANVDLSTLSVTVQESSSNTYTTEYTLASDITEIDANSAVYFVEEDHDLNYTFYFGDNVLGKRPANNNIIIATYLDTVGSGTNNISKFAFVEPIGGYFSDNVTITADSSTYAGTDKEPIESIRFRAPIFYTSQNRAVTKNDYEVLLLKDYNNLDAVSVWGGEENDPVVYGKVFISLKTKGFYTLTNLEKENIKNTLIENRNVLTVVPEIVDPDYCFVMVSGKVFFDPKLTSKTATELMAYVQAAILDYNNDELNTFKSVLKKSKLQQYIEACEPSITGSDIDISLQRQILLSLAQSKKYEVQFHTPILKGSFYTWPTVEMVDTNYITRQVFFEEVPNVDSGVESIEILNAGINFSSAPTVTISGDGSGATAEARVFGGRIIGIDVLTPGTNYTRATVTIEGEGSEAVAAAVLQSRIGTLRTYYYKTNGEKVVVSSSAGSINYDTGKITIDAFTPLLVTPNAFYDDDVLTLNAVSDSDIITPLRNRILAIDASDSRSIQMEVLPE
jgi:hypothetical protein